MTDISVFGTSNSLLKRGYAQALGKGFKLHNYSVGGCCSLFSLQELSRPEIVIGDVAIIDHAVNDYEHISKSLIDETSLKIAIEDLYRYTAQKFRLSYSLIFPVRALVLERGGEIADFHRQMATKYSVVLVDIYDLYDIFSSQMKHATEVFFRDNFHILESIANMIGKALCEDIEARSENYFDDDNPKLSPHAFPYYFNDLKEQKHGKDNVLGSSARKENVLRIFENEKLYVDPKIKLLGVFMESKTTNGKVFFRSDCGIENELKYTKSNNLKVQFIFVPLEYGYYSDSSRGFICTDGEASIVGFLQTVETETPDFAIDHNEFEFNMESMFCLEGIYEDWIDATYQTQELTARLKRALLKRDSSMGEALKEMQILMSATGDFKNENWARILVEEWYRNPSAMATDRQLPSAE